MGEKNAIHIVVHKPETPDGQAELAKRIAEIHADTIIRRIKNLNCPVKQKLELLDAVIGTVRQRNARQDLQGCETIRNMIE